MKPHAATDSQQEMFSNIERALNGTEATAALDKFAYATILQAYLKPQKGTSSAAVAACLKQPALTAKLGSKIRLFMQKVVNQPTLHSAFLTAADNEDAGTATGNASGASGVVSMATPANAPVKHEVEKPGAGCL